MMRRKGISRKKTIKEFNHNVWEKFISDSKKKTNSSGDGEKEDEDEII